MKKAVLPVILTKEYVFSRLGIRDPESHKGRYGRALAVCGSPRFRGAAALCSMGALRAGVGLYTLAAPECVIAAAAPRVPEAMYLPLPDESLAQEMEKADVCLVGCGLPDDDETARIVRLALARAKTLVLDAGALTALAHDAGLLRAARGPVILTPHPGEMARLCGRSVSDITAGPARTALEFAADTGAVVLLKGHRTYAAAPDGALLENRTGNAGLARGGSGDLLAGIVTALAAQGLAPLDAAGCGAWLHGTAADLCAKRLSMQGMLPEDIVSDLSAIFLENESQV